MRARERRAAALRGRGGRRRAGDPRAAGVARGRARRAHPRHRQRHDELHPHRDGAHAASPTRRRSARRQELGYAEADPTDDVTGRDAAAKMAILARLAFSTPVHLDQVVYEGIEHLTGRGHGVRAASSGSGLKLIGTAERVDGGISVRVHPAFLYARAPAGVGPRAVQRGHGRVGRDHRGDAVAAPARAGRRPRRAVLGDVISAMIPPASTPETTEALPVVNDVESAFYLHLEVADRPGVLAQVAELLGMQGASIRSVVQKGLGENARLVHDHAPAAGVALLRRRAADRPARLHPLGRRARSA